jgi:hypothetical protein
MIMTTSDYLKLYCIISERVLYKKRKRERQKKENTIIIKPGIIIIKSGLSRLFVKIMFLFAFFDVTLVAFFEIL